MSFPPPLPGPETPGEGLPEIVPPRPAPGQQGGVPAPPPVRRAGDKPLVGALGDVVRTGRWDAPRRTVAYQVMGNLKLDLREVVVPGESLEVDAYVMMGDVRVLVPPGTDVQVKGMTVLGDGRTETEAFGKGVSPTGARVEVTVYSLMGNVRVRTAAVGSKLPVGWRWARPKR